MAIHGKLYRKAAEGHDPVTRYQPHEALERVKTRAFAKFDETGTSWCASGWTRGTPTRSCAARSSSRTGRGRRSASW